MKKVFLLLFAFLFAVVATAADDGNYHYDYDRFTKTSSHFWRDSPKVIDTGDGISGLNISFGVIKSPDETLFHAMFIFYPVIGERYNFSECGDIYWLVDGAILTPDLSANIDGEEIGSGKDVLVSTFKKTTYQKFLNAKVVEYRICNNEFVLSDKQRQGIENLF